jgi:hypothetical protein
MGPTSREDNSHPAGDIYILLHISAEGKELFDFCELFDFLLIFLLRIKKMWYS